MTTDESPSSLWLVCPRCGQEFPLPNDGTIKPVGILALPNHPSFDDPEDRCPVSEQLVRIQSTYHDY